MKKHLLSVLFVLISFTGWAQQEEIELPPLDPAYVGTHGMVLVSHSSTIFAYHLPLYHKPHDVQVLYKLDVKDLALVQLVRDAEMVTIKPEEFNLQRLIRGEKLILTADVYMGHFERGGELVYSGVPLNFSEQLYVRQLNDIAESSNSQKYDVVSYRKNLKIYIHQIQQAPSFDHLLHIDQNAGCRTKFNTSSAVPKENELQYKFINCGTMSPMYFETENFKKH